MNLINKLKKVKHRVFKFKSNTDIQIMTSGEMKEKAAPYLDELSEKDVYVHSEDIKRIVNMQMRTAARELVVQKLAESGDYSIDKPLIIMNPYGYVPLSAIAIFATKKPCSSRMWVECDRETRIVGELPPTTHHRIPIVGMFGGRINNIYIKLKGSGMRSRTLKFSIEAPELPEEMKGIVKKLSINGESAYPFYYASGVDSWFPYIFDSKGRVRYYIIKPGKNYGVFPMADGILFHSDRGVLTPGFGVPHSTYVHEMDLLGRIRRTLHIAKGLHHDAVEMSPGGNYLVATSTLVNYCEDVVAEIDRKTGHIVRSIEMNNVFNDERVKDSPDWAHLNTVSYYAPDNSVIVCLRNLHSIIKFDWGTGKILWMLGDPEFWRDSPMKEYLLMPDDEDIKWFYQAHASFQIPAEPDDEPDTIKIAIYDNHWQSRRKTENFDGDPNSYGIIYRVNEKYRTVEMVRSYESRKSSVRSNIVYDKKKDRVLVLSGCLNKKYRGCRGLVYDYSMDGELINLYGTTKQFYRVYPYKIDYNSIAMPLEYDTKEFGSLDHTEEISPIDVSGAIPLPPSDRNEENTPAEPKNEFPSSVVKPREVKEKEYEEYAQGRSWAELDHTGRIGRTNFKLVGNILMFYAVDHIVTHLYMVSADHTYMMDYTNTWQDIPALFYNYGYNMAIPLDNIADGSYHLYVKCFDVLYDTDHSFNISRGGAEER